MLYLLSYAPGSSRRRAYNFVRKGSIASFPVRAEGDRKPATSGAKRRAASRRPSLPARASLRLQAKAAKRSPREAARPAAPSAAKPSPIISQVADSGMAENSNRPRSPGS